METELAELQHIMSIFNDYIAESDSFEVACSPIVGYVYMNYDRTDAFRIIDNASQLCSLIFREIAVDSLVAQSAYDLEPRHASKTEKAAIRKRLKPYLLQLPEYRHLLEQILE